MSYEWCHAGPDPASQFASQPEGGRRYSRWGGREGGSDLFNADSIVGAGFKPALADWAIRESPLKKKPRGSDVSFCFPMAAATVPYSYSNSLEH
jgi:hypothetical protein